jgi:hypothetical protein
MDRCVPDSSTSEHARTRAARTRAVRLLAALLAGMALATAAVAATTRPFHAHAGLALASAAAEAWAEDATLVYVENDEPVDERGASPRWGYLFHSPSLDQSRAYSVRNGKILVAETLAMKFEAPPLGGDWIDSGAALSIAQNAAREFRVRSNAKLGHMILVRGAFQDDDPDPPAWTFVYTAPHSPSLFVVVDAAAGKVKRTWRG